MLISALDNPCVKQAGRLLADASFRRKSGLFAAEGARLCADAALSGLAIERVLYTANAAEHYPDYLQAVLAVGAPSAEVTDAVMRRLSDTQHPQGIVCIVRVPDTSAAFAGIHPNGRYLALEDVRDPGNLGAAVRSAEALGIDGLLLSDGCCDLYNPKALRASMGGAFRLPIIPAGDMADAVVKCRDNGMAVYACVADADALPIEKADFSHGAVCLIGNEGNGLRAETIAACTGRITIPMKGRAESLNASACAAIVMWELMRGA